ncbi:hypothetical protein BZG36_03874 [Bifiguratus adelaidae]|uniref:Riboflavin kinase n=1 Tax=Bifiguratus adelaidae TaxID=1938954 RepID=A0A261XY14_9FUNG|nr:hypothetical protein BZG36_03874 [Bifiguratus adelaidae]
MPERRLNTSRPMVLPPDAPTTPFPIRLSGHVVKGFGRGSKELGIPTANLSDDALKALCEEIETGIYYGWVQLGDKDTAIHPMVMSVGWNPYYHNEKKSAEVHVIHQFEHDFYNAQIRVIVLGYIRAEQNYPSLDALIEDILTDVEVAKNCLDRKAYLEYKQDELFVHVKN